MEPPRPLELGDHVAKAGLQHPHSEYTGQQGSQRPRRQSGCLINTRALAPSWEVGACLRAPSQGDEWEMKSSRHTLDQTQCLALGYIHPWGVFSHSHMGTTEAGSSWRGSPTFWSQVLFTLKIYGRPQRAVVHADRIYHYVPY